MWCIRFRASTGAFIPQVLAGDCLVSAIRVPLVKSLVYHAVKNFSSWLKSELPAYFSCFRQNYDTGVPLHFQGIGRGFRDTIYRLFVHGNSP